MYHRVVNIPVFVTRRLRGCLEFVLVLLIWGVLVALPISSYEVYVERGYVAEALFQATVIKQEMTAWRAVIGDWPAAADMPNVDVQGNDRRSLRVDYEEGAFTIVLRRNNVIQRVGFRAAVSESSPRAPVVWLCGYASPPDGYRVVASPRTDIPMLYLPSACRGTA
jgi:type IV pilus assembly protein PilA